LYAELRDDELEQIASVILAEGAVQCQTV
jgi:hypothetical protein